jgi:transcriptional regulator with PAS, ATPase and Fis domain
MASSRSVGVRRLAALFHRAREAVFVLDARRRIVYVNPAWEALTGQQGDQVMGLVCEPRSAKSDGNLDNLGGSFCPPPEALAGRPASGTSLIVHAAGERQWRRIEYWPWHVESGALLGLVGIVRDLADTPHAPESDAMRLRSELQELRERLQEQHGLSTLVGRGPAHRRLLDQIALAAATNVPVLIIGETGTGKRTIARIIHARGRSPKAPLLPHDCAAVPPEALERELFGPPPPNKHLNLPEGSTLLLIEAVQLPRDLQERMTNGRDDTRVRLLATTTAEPEAALREDRIRADYYFAITDLVLRVPPLRERLDDLPLLAQHFLEQPNTRGERLRIGFSPEALDVLRSYDWPGNLRELARVIEAAHSRAEGDIVQLNDLPAAIRGHYASAYTPPPMPPQLTPLDQTLEQLERRMIEHALQRARQNKSRAAELLEISRPRLYRRIKELGIPDEPELTEEAAPSLVQHGVT